MTRKWLALDMIFGVFPAIILMIPCSYLFFSSDFILIFAKRNSISDVNLFFESIFGFLGCAGILMCVFDTGLKNLKNIKIFLLICGLIASVKFNLNLNHLSPHQIINKVENIDVLRSIFTDYKIALIFLWLFFAPSIIALKYIYLLNAKSPLEVQP